MGMHTAIATVEELKFIYEFPSWSLGTSLVEFGN